MLLFLGTAKKPTINDLHRAFLHRRSTLTSVIDRLEKRGFVKRTPAAEDRRSLTLALTSAGAKAADCVLAVLAELESALDASRSQVSTAARLVERIAQTAAEALDAE